jgi:hypothetical protein
MSGLPPKADIRALQRPDLNQYRSPISTIRLRLEKITGVK